MPQGRYMSLWRCIIGKKTNLGGVSYGIRIIKY